MVQRLIDRLLEMALTAATKHSYLRLLVIIVLASEAFTLLMNTINSFLWWGELSVDLLLIGTVDAFIVSCLVGAGIIFLIYRLRDSASLARHEKDKLDTIFASMGEGVAIMDSNHLINYQNESHRSMMGEHLGEYCYKAYHGRDSVCEGCPVELSFSDGGTHTLEKEVAGEGPSRYFEVTAAPIADEYGNLSSAVEITRDVTDARRADRAVRGSERRYRTLIELANDAIMVADADTGHILDANKKAGELLGRPVEEIIGMHQSELGPPEKTEYMENKFRENVDKGEAKTAGVYLRHSSGKLIPVEISDAVIEVDGRKYMHGIFHDLSARKEVEEQKDEFLAMLRHDMKTPLAVISGNAQSALLDGGGCLSEGLETMLRTILRNAGSLASMIDDLSVISRLESGGYAINRKPTDICLLLLEATMDVKGKAAEKGISFSKDISDGLPEVSVDESHLKRAVVNLVQNALLYTPEGGIVTLSAKKAGNGHGDGVVISVTDDGPGIPAEEQSRVFDKYYRASSSKGKHGSGLGLAIVKGVAESHGGRVELESEPGKGARFSIILPSGDA
jgi:PAS domain S-box-containing protein